MPPDPEPTIALTSNMLQDGHNRRRREFNGRIIRAGRITRADGEPGPFTIPATVIRNAVEAGMFNGLAIFADHPGFFQAPRFYTSDEEQADGRLADILVDTLDVIISDRQEGIPAPDLGISLTFWPVWEQGDDRPRILQAFKKIDSADLVFSPAADGRILEALSARAHTVGGNERCYSGRP
jgi:hypothetical protein